MEGNIEMSNGRIALYIRLREVDWRIEIAVKLMAGGGDTSEYAEILKNLRVERSELRERLTAPLAALN